MWILLPALAHASDVIGEEPHAELAVGFFAGDRSLGLAPLGLIDEAPGGYPLHDALVLGPRVEGRAVVPPLRASLGYQRPYPDWELPAAPEVRALTAHEVLLGVGLEAPTGLLVPFVDLVGVVHLTTATLQVDDRTRDRRSESFSLGGRAGLRLQVSDHTFVEAAGEGAPLGPRTWGASVGIGLAAF